MTIPIVGIDHIVVAVNDLDRAAESYRRLGFTVSPRGMHSAAMGTANHTIMLQRDYFELLAVLAPTERNRPWREALEEGDGIVALAVATPTAAAARSAWTAAGINPLDLIRFSRPVERPGGAAVDAKFEVAQLPGDAVPGASIFACGHLTRESVWLPELMDHPNTAVAIRTLAVAAPDPATAAQAWARALVGSSVSAVESGVRIAIGPHAVDVIDPQTAARRFGLAQAPAQPKPVAIDFAVRDPEACRRQLAREGIAARIEGARIAVAPEEACGVAVTMVPANGLP
jgi:catechol 2,3-dioxygenase-like lactoylglutathione lyase family enzyme